MPNIPTSETQASQSSKSPEDRLGPAEHPSFETELMSAEKRLRYAREHPLFGVHPDGVGPTLGQDLGRPNPGHDVDWNSDEYDPPT